MLKTNGTNQTEKRFPYRKISVGMEATDLRVFLSTSSLYILFVPVSLLISCDFFNAPYTGLILFYSTAGVCVIIIHKAMSMIKILSLTWYLKDNECEAFS